MADNFEIENTSQKAAYPQFNSYADIDAYFSQKEAERIERDREREEERQRKMSVAQAMGDLGHVLIDTIKAGGGAMVTPRDVTSRYQQMEERNQRIYDNYRARMDLISKQQQQNAMALQRQKEANARWEKEMQQRKEIAEMEEEGRNKRAEATDAYKYWKTEQDNKTKRDMVNAKLKSGVSANGTKYKIWTFQNHDYTIPDNAMESRIVKAYLYLQKNNLLSNASGANSEMTSIANMMKNGGKGASQESINAMRTAVLTTLNDMDMEGVDSAHAEAIGRILNGGSVTTTKPAGNSNASNDDDNTLPALRRQK